MERIWHGKGMQPYLIEDMERSHILNALALFLRYKKQGIYIDDVRKKELTLLREELEKREYQENIRLCGEKLLPIDGS